MTPAEMQRYMMDLPDDASLCVLNNVDRGGQREKGEFNFRVREGADLVDVKIERTWLPRDLTTQVTLASLKRSPEMRRFIAQGLIKLITEEEAVELLQNPETDAEIRRLSDRAARVNPGDDSPPLAELADRSVAVRQDLSSEVEGNFITDLINRTKTGNLTVAKAASMIRALLDQTSVKDVVSAMQASPPQMILTLLEEHLENLGDSRAQASKKAAPAAKKAASAVPAAAKAAEAARATPVPRFSALPKPPSRKG